MKSEVLGGQVGMENFNKMMPSSASMWVNNNKKMQKKYISSDKKSIKL